MIPKTKALPTTLRLSPNKNARRRYRLFILLLAICGLLSLAGLPFVKAQSAKDDTSTAAQKIAWLRKSTTRIRTIDPADEDFADLQPLKRIIGNSRIVMLGEQSHGDGATFLAKTRLIKFLHQQMGFDVLAFESGLYDCHKAWTFIQSGEDPARAASRGIFAVWTSSKQVQPLLSYLGEAAKTKVPLELAGFDMQLTGTASKDFLLSDLEQFVRHHTPALIESKDWALFKSTMESLFSGKPQWRQYTLEQRTQFSTAMENIRLNLTKPNEKDLELAREASFWSQTLASVNAMLKFFWSFDPQNPNVKITNMRDEQMANNLLWLAEKFYPKRKIIVWGATSHLTRNRNLIETDAARGMIPMGQSIWERLGGKIYVLGVTSYQGQTGLPFDGERGTPQDLEPASADSLEYLLNAAGFEFGILNFRGLTPQARWLHEKIMSRPMGHTPMKANWTDVMDGLLFIKEMKPSTK